MTTPDGADKLTPLAPAVFGGAAPTVPTVVVDPTLTYQVMQGFGGAITDSSATVLYRLSPAARAAAMRSLFDPVTGDGLDYLRQPIGASDFVATADYTYDDLPAGQTDYSQSHFSVKHDQAQILPLLREAKALNPRLQVIASPWSPPAWMKTNDSLIGGRLIDDPRIYRSDALYLLKFVEAYKANGVTVNAITVQNEPQNRTPSGYPGTDMPSVQEENVIQDLGPMLRAASLRTQIFACDHNWTEHPNDVAATPPDETADINAYPQNVLKSPAARYVAGVAYHCYYGDPSAMTALHDQFPDQAIYFTECSGSQSADPANTTGAAQTGGQYLQVDFGRAVAARQVVFDTGVSGGDYPRGYTVTVSADGTNWSTAASGQGTGQFTAVNLSGAPVRYVRMTLTASSGSWWSVADVRAYTR
ncbi:MAG TPA: discoidin domain-containing protein [Streptosporangiaceae bacterium]|nr:discoidin domain-containing protein [Streptosporangiaceae bacterium]